MIAESYSTSVSEAASRYSLHPTQIFEWRRIAREAGGCAFTPVVVQDQVAARVDVLEVAIAAAVVRIPPGFPADLVRTVLITLKGSR